MLCLRCPCHDLAKKSKSLDMFDVHNSIAHPDYEQGYVVHMYGLSDSNPVAT